MPKSIVPDLKQQIDFARQVYERDLAAGINPDIPENYFPGDDPSKDPIVTWKSHGNLLFNNWLNYYVYQLTPFDIAQIGDTRQDNISFTG